MSVMGKALRRRHINSTEVTPLQVWVDYAVVAIHLTEIHMTNMISKFALLFLITGIIAVRIVTEEQFLRTRFPEYKAYARTTRRVIPYII